MAGPVLGDLAAAMIRTVAQSSLPAARAAFCPGLPANYMWPGELDVLVSLMRLADRPKHIVEMGCHEGRTAAIVLASIREIQSYIGIDVQYGYVPAINAQRNEVPTRPGWRAAHDPRFRLLLSRNGSLDLGPQDIGPADVVFIDGDHSRRVVLHDTALARAVLRNGGVIVWHDVGNELADVSEVLAASDLDVKHVEGTWLGYWIKPWDSATT